MSSFPLGTDVYVLSNNSEHAAKIVGPVISPITSPVTSLQTIRVKWTVRGGEDDVDIKRVKIMWDEVRRPNPMRLCVCVESVSETRRKRGVARLLLETLVLPSTFFF